MDISRPDIKKKKLRRQIIVLAIVAVGVTAAAWAVMRLKPAVPSVDASIVWPETVKRGDFTRNVRGLGTLVPREESIELIPAQTDATVVRIRVLPGTMVKPDTILMDLSDPQLRAATGQPEAGSRWGPGRLQEPPGHAQFHHHG